MAYLSPLATDTLLSKDHAKMHNVVDMEATTPNGSLLFDASGNATFAQNTVITKNLTVDTNTLFVDATAHAVAIGQATAPAKLTISKDSATYAQIAGGAFDMALGIAVNTALISGLDFANFNAGGQVRFLARNDQGDYITMNSFGSTASGTLFGQNRTDLHAIFTSNGTGTDKKLAIGTFTAGDLILGTNNLERMRITSAGLVGVGMTPTNLFTVKAGGGAISITGTTDDTAGNPKISSTGTLFIYGASGIQPMSTILPSADISLNLGSTTRRWLNFYSQGISSIGTAVGINTLLPTTALTFGGTDPVISVDTLDTADNKRLILTGGGAASITRGAYYYLSGNEYTAGDRGIMYFVGGNPTTPLTGDGRIAFVTGNAVERMRIGYDGNILVGGNTDATTKMEIIGGSAGVETKILQLRTSGGTANTGTAIQFVNSSVSGAETAGGGKISVIRNATDGGEMVFSVTRTTTLAEALRILPSGNLLLNGTAGVATNAISFGSGAARKIWIENAVDTSTVGRALTVSAGSALNGGTDNQVGGNLILQSGLGKGTGASSILFETGTTRESGSNIQTMSTKMTLTGAGNLGIGEAGPVEYIHLGTGSTGLRAVMQIGSYASLGTIWSSGKYVMGNNVKPAPVSTGAMHIMTTHASYGGRAITMQAGVGIQFHTLSGSVTAGDVFDSPRMTINEAGVITIPGLTASELLATDGSKNLVSLAVATYPSLTEISYVKGTTSSIQTQLNAKAPINSPTFTGTVSGITKAMVGLTNVDDTSDATKNSATATLTNKRITQRVVTTADDSTAVIDVDVTDQYQLTAMANATTISTTGTPTAGQKLMIRLKDNGTARALTWDAVFRAIGVTAPTTTVISKTTYIGCVYNLTDTKWDILAVGQEA